MILTVTFPTKIIEMTKMTGMPSMKSKPNQPWLKCCHQLKSKISTQYVQCKIYNNTVVVISDVPHEYNTYLMIVMFPHDISFNEDSKTRINIHANSSWELSSEVPSIV